MKKKCDLSFFFKLSHYLAVDITSTKPFSREIALVNINRKERGNKERSSSFFLLLYNYKASSFWKQIIFYLFFLFITKK